MATTTSVKEQLAGQPAAETVEHPTPSAEVAVRAPGGMSLGGKVEYAKLLATSGLLPKQYRGEPANLLWAIEFGEMLGLPPMAAITGVHIIEGKPSASAALISALVRRAGHRLRVKGDDQVATAQIVRADDPDYVFESRWTIERARQAGITGKSVWKQYPASMLKARAITEVARDACEEALCGVHYTPEELGANVAPDEAPPTWGQASPPPAAPAPAAQSNGVDYAAMARGSGEFDGVRQAWAAASADGALTDELRAELNAIAADFKARAEATAPPAAAEDVIEDAVVVDEATGEITPAAGFDDQAWLGGDQ